VEINLGDRLPLRTYQELNYRDFKFETIGISYENNNNNNTRSRVKRDTSSSSASSLIDRPYLQTNRLTFKAFNRRFHLLLKKDVDLVSDKFDIEIRYASSSQPSEHLSDFLTSNYYTGIVDNEPDSYVVCYFEQPSASPTQPLVYAQISIRNERENAIYYVEPLLDVTGEHESSAEYIVYRSEDVQSDVIANGIFK
jgi:hypothetical protein